MIRRNDLKSKLKVINQQLSLGISHLGHGNKRRNIEAPPMALPAVYRVLAV
jgi:hypothetical protein